MTFRRNDRTEETRYSAASPPPRRRGPEFDHLTGAQVPRRPVRARKRVIPKCMPPPKAGADAS